MASIPYPKVWVIGEILKAADLNAQFAAVVSITGLDTGAIADAAITTAKIAALNVTKEKLAVGASVNSGLTAAVNAGLAITNTETTVLTYGSITTRGGLVILGGSWGMFITLLAGPVTGTVTVRIKLDAVQVYAFAVTVQNLDTAFALTVPGPAFPAFSHTPTSGAHVYTVTVETSSASIQATTPGASAGTGYVVELA